MPTPSARAPYRSVLAFLGASVALLAVLAGEQPGPLGVKLQGTGVSAVVLFVGLVACGRWVLRTASGSAWRWAAGIGIALASAELAGMALLRYGAWPGPLLTRADLAWSVVHWLGTAWLVTFGLAALIQVLDTHRTRSTSDPARRRHEGHRRRTVRLVASLRASSRRRRWPAVLVVMTALVLSRVPYLVVYWPGIVSFDTFRSYAYARGTYPWQTYEPVGHSLLIDVMQWSGSALGWGDAGGVAIGSVSAILASSAAFTFLLQRMAVWGLRPALWVVALAWLALSPVLGYFSVAVVKDVPFSIAMVVFLVCLGELSLRGPSTATKWWPWVILAVAGIAAVTLRNNGIHVMALSLPLLLLPLRHLWKRILVVAAALVLAYATYVGPVYASLRVQPFPPEEAYALPLQQLGRIAKVHSSELSPAEREFITRTFGGRPPDELGKHYVPYLADPMKLSAREAWAAHGTAAFLVGWAGLVVRYPGTAIEATMASTVGYWDPAAPSYDGITRWSSNDVRDIHLDIPSGKPTSGLAAAIESSGIMPTKTYWRGLGDDGYRAIPVLGLVMSPGAVCWAWLVAALLVLRRRARTALAVFVPVGALLLTFLAGPVSGGQRYSLTLFMALPLALAAAALAKRPAEPLTPAREI